MRCVVFSLRLRCSSLTWCPVSGIPRGVRHAFHHGGGRASGTLQTSVVYTAEVSTCRGLTVSQGTGVWRPSSATGQRSARL